MKRLSAFCLALLICTGLFSACAHRERLGLPEGKTANYLEQRYMLPCGEGFVCQRGDMHYALFSEGGVHYLDENPVEAVMQKDVILLNADEGSVCYAELVTAEHYGKGTGWRVYRFYPASGKRELIYKDVAVSGTDGLLGLEDVLGLSPLTVDHLMQRNAFFLINGGRAVPEYELADRLRQKAAEKGFDIKLPDSQLRIAVSGSRFFFADSLGTLWLFNEKSGEFTPLSYSSVSCFFVTSDRLFVVPEYGANVDVLDLNCNKLAEVETAGVELGYPLVFDRDDIYISSAGFELVRIDASLTLHRTGILQQDVRWTVMDGRLYSYSDGVIAAEAINNAAE